MIAPLTRSIAATAAKRMTRLETTKSAGGRRAGRPVCGTGGYRCKAEHGCTRRLSGAGSIGFVQLSTMYLDPDRTGPQVHLDPENPDL